ncbi:hypothetical protein ACHAWF_010184 [Thalassiosira exigua]
MGGSEAIPPQELAGDNQEVMRRRDGPRNREIDEMAKNVQKIRSPAIKASPDHSQPGGPRILESSGVNQQWPFFHYQNGTHSKPQHFSLHSHPNINVYETYGTTLTIIVLLHMLYFHQWNKRRSRQDVCTSYEQLVEKKQFYRAILAVVSHPPVEGGERDTNLVNAGSHHGGGENDQSEGPIRRSGFLQRCMNCNLFNRVSPILQYFRPMYNLVRLRIFNPLIYGSLSGLPLLAFSSHILWQCRALEELYDVHDGKLILGVSSDMNVTQFWGIGTAAVKMSAHDVSEHSSSGDEYNYFRVLVALAFTSLLLELIISRSMLKRIDQVVGLDGNRNTPHQLLSQRAMCSIASLATALLGVYDSHFPYAPPPVLPFVRVTFLSSSGFSLVYSIMILTLLTHRIHPVTSIMCGLMSGSLWSLGATKFLGTRYWGNAMLFSLVLAIVLSLKSQPSYSQYLVMLVPCLDYVAWDSEGLIPERVSGSSYANSSNHPVGHGDLETGSNFQTHNGGQGHDSPLLPSQSSAIRGRLPHINTMESELSDASDLARANEESVPAASSRYGPGLSRRGGPGSQ